MQYSNIVICEAIKAWPLLRAKFGATNLQTVQYSALQCSAAQCSAGQHPAPGTPKTDSLSLTLGLAPHRLVAWYWHWSTHALTRSLFHKHTRTNRRTDGRTDRRTTRVLELLRAGKKTGNKN